MGLVDQYSSSEDELIVPTKAKKFKIDTAPDVGLEDVYLKEKLYPMSGQLELPINLPYDITSQLEVGPHNNIITKTSKQNTLTGTAEEHVMSEFDFRQRERDFKVLGYANNPSEFPGTEFVGDTDLALQNDGASTFSSRIKHNKDLKRFSKGDSSVLDGDTAYKGPWAGYENETKGTKVGPTEEELAEWSASRKVDQNTENGPSVAAPGALVEKTIFHGKTERDYQGRTFIEYPRDINDPNVSFTREVGSQTCYAPKKSIHQFTAHAKGVTSIKYLPKTGHLLLSSGMDGEVKIWDCYHSNELLRSYIGHSKAVRDITFDNKGKRFLSTSFDKYIKLWDTETGQVISRFTSGKTPYMSRLHPADQNIFIVGQADKKIAQWDIRSKQKVQEYDDHLGAVSTVTFVDGGRKFLSTSDDKTMRLWEYGIPVVIKMVADPSMHSMPAVSVHPSKKWIACQSLDNQILVWSGNDKLKPNRKKEFTGHLVAGYACQMDFSPDGSIITSGDAEGKVWFWDWKTCRVLRKFHAHKAVTIATAWSPVETSKMATCSWDGTIRFWD
ncbi:hypothetical protein BB561_005407 [Smittium simulii]|uniref:Pre-mRNA-processing factor 17 n=1 Tax=Smittium simulii TaxID=133385 RepID=A0A2T9YAH7_9FUNG|nr:hypothetical protein BB561_005407 [Smittium simulii]